jgi:hypothetical protein
MSIKKKCRIFATCLKKGELCIPAGRVVRATTVLPSVCVTVQCD